MRASYLSCSMLPLNPSLDAESLLKSATVGRGLLGSLEPSVSARESKPCEAPTALQEKADIGPPKYTSSR